MLVAFFVFCLQTWSNLARCFFLYIKFYWDTHGHSFAHCLWHATTTELNSWKRVQEALGTENIYYLAPSQETFADPFSNLTHRNSFHKNGQDGRAVGGRGHCGAWESLGSAPMMHLECGLSRDQTCKPTAKEWTWQTSDSQIGLRPLGLQTTCRCPFILSEWGRSQGERRGRPLWRAL